MMLYVLPPPSAPKPPSPWSTIVSAAESRDARDARDAWVAAGERPDRRHPPRARIIPCFKAHNNNKEVPELESLSTDEEDGVRAGKSLSECYFANKGAALVLAATEGRAAKIARRAAAAAAAAAATHALAAQSDIQQHLQSMFYLLRPEETLKMAVKLESAHPSRTRYLVVVCRAGSRGEEVACLLGIDCNETTTVGLVLKVLADTAISLDGDGGFSVSVCGRQHIFKPVSVQAMWSALQTLHRVSARAREYNHYGAISHAWAEHYEQRIGSDRSCLNEWHAMDCLESRRPPSPDSRRNKPREREETERVIRSTLKEIMMSVDLDEVTSKVIRGRLEEDLDMDLGEFKSFIDQEMLIILGQMDAPTEIFDHVYLGSEWNASNLEELQRNGVRHILNVTREIDNFFPGMFDYLNVRVYDDEKTDLLKHWDDTFKYITKAKKEGSKVLVHCKMGVSRSASVVIAYAMKAYNWDFDKAIRHVKKKRNCIKPNSSFLTQLETYQGILDAMKNKEKLQRSKSETNLKSPSLASKLDSKIMEPTPLIQALSHSCGGRPRSWSPDTKLAMQLLPPTSLSMESLIPETKHMFISGANGSYSVSQNQIMHLREDGVPSVKLIVSELESTCQATIATERRSFRDRKNLRLNIQSKSESTSVSPVELMSGDTPNADRSSQPTAMLNLADGTHTWDPGESVNGQTKDCGNDRVENSIVKCDSGVLELNVKVKPNDLYSNRADQIFDKEDKRKYESNSPSRQGSWSSFDSAVMVDLSRHSSWGSYDTRVSRNSSCGSSDEPRYASALKRTKHKAEENVASKTTIDSESSCCNGDIFGPAAIQKASAALSDLDIIREKNENVNLNDNFKDARAIVKEAICDHRKSCFCGSTLDYTRLSVSAPTESCLCLKVQTSPQTCSSLNNLPKISNARASKPNSKTRSTPNSSRSISGLVRNLKKEFEAKSASTKITDAAEAEGDAKKSTGKHKSLPVSPVSVHVVRSNKVKKDSNDSAEDFSVKLLVDKYDGNVKKCTNEPVVGDVKKTNEPPVPLRKSSLSCDVKHLNKNKPSLRNSFCGVLRSAPTASRPPIAPNVVSMNPNHFPNSAVTSVVSKSHTKKQLQHGKTHPLTRLNLTKSSNRCSNPVYNTM